MKLTALFSCVSPLLVAVVSLAGCGQEGDPVGEGANPGEVAGYDLRVGQVAPSNRPPSTTVMPDQQELPDLVVFAPLSEFDEQGQLHQRTRVLNMGHATAASFRLRVRATSVAHHLGQQDLFSTQIGILIPNAFVDVELPLSCAKAILTADPEGVVPESSKDNNSIEFASSCEPHNDLTGDTRGIPAND